MIVRREAIPLNKVGGAVAVLFCNKKRMYGTVRYGLYYTKTSIVQVYSVRYGVPVHVVLIVMYCTYAARAILLHSQLNWPRPPT